MNQFIAKFLIETPAKLFAVRSRTKILRDGLDDIDKYSARQILREIFQEIHTLKGSATAFRIETVGALAHQIENLLESLRRDQIVLDKKALDALDGGIEKLEVALSAFREKDSAALPPDLVVKINSLTKNKKKASSNKIRLPMEFLRKLNQNEKEHLEQCATDGATIFVIAVDFKINEFQTKLLTLRARLEQNGETIAHLPGAFVSSNTIALQIVYAAKTSLAQEIIEIIKSCEAVILFAHERQATFAESLATALFAGQRIAAEQNKAVKFKIVNGDLKISQKQADALATMLLHLITNAVAHGIELPEERLKNKKKRSGLITIAARQEAASIVISVADDGRGIDFKKIIKTANEILKINIDSDQSLQAQNLLFEPGFSTAAIASQAAGRGIGLDAARSAAESVNGLIKVSSKLGAGSTFEITLPQL